jgi:hypothetical protein
MQTPPWQHLLLTPFLRKGVLRKGSWQKVKNCRQEVPRFMGPHLRTSGAERTEISEKQKKVRAAFLSISRELNRAAKLRQDWFSEEN